MKHLIPTTPDEVLQQHGIGALMYSRFEKAGGIDYWKKNFLYNHSYLKEVKEIYSRWPSDSVHPVLLKGTSLLLKLYENMGERPMSDCDLLVSEEGRLLLDKILQDMGYSLADTGKWHANRFKSIYVVRRQGLQLVFEVHTQLFYHSNDAFSTAPISYDKLLFHSLSPEEEFVHLCGHLGFQHNFRKLFWLLDIFLYLDKLPLDLERVVAVAKKWQVYNSLKAVAFLEARLTHQDSLLKAVTLARWEEALLGFVFGSEFITQPLLSKTKYYLLKTYLKDRPLENVRYNLLWMNQKLKEI